MTVDEMRTPTGSVAPDDATGESFSAGGLDSVGVALSGGGIRAALFSLGVLVGLVETGENRRVTNISSVSGGSIVNAAVAQTCEFASIETTTQFESVAKPIAETLCRRGVFVFSRSALLAFAHFVGPRLGGVVVVGLFAYGGIAGILQERQLDGLPWGWIVAGLVVIVVGTLFLSRGAAQEALYASVLGGLDGGKAFGHLDKLRESTCTHVLVATDLVSAAPVFFSRQFVCCPPFGWGTAEGTRTASAVYASAAFPAVFPAKRFRRQRFEFQNGSASPPFPRLLKLNDGGVYNNLGTDWFDVLESQETAEIWRFGNLQPPPALTPVARRIVVNAGAASRRLRRVPPFLAISRTMSVLYDNTVRPRLQSMRELATDDLTAPVVIDISESPYNIARRHADVDVNKFAEHQRDNAGECKKRADLLAHHLERKGETFWIEFARQTSGTPTKLTRAGLESGARMIFHGYLSTLVVMHILHGVELTPEQMKDEGYFLDLAGRRKHTTGPSGSTGSVDMIEDAPDAQ